MALQKIGALWAKDKNGKRFLAGEIELVRGGEKIRVMVFKNEDKQGKQPDYTIVRADDDDRTRAQIGPEPTIQRGNDVDDDELPF